jgi:hypothetical protein
MSAFGLTACTSPPNNSAPGDLPGVSSAQATRAASGGRFAVSHSFTLRLPSGDVEAIQQRDLTECAKLGCTVLNTRLDRSNEGRVNARSSLRIAPDGYAALVKVIAAPPARVIVHSESAEDKTAPRLDVEKRLEVKSALRDRLTDMLRDTGTNSVADLATIAKELAEVQGDIEAAVAQRDYLRTITDTVLVDINYNGLPTLIGGIDFSPIGHAIHGVSQTVVASVAALISFLAAIIPWLPLVALVVWIVRVGLRRWKARKSPA